MSDEHRPLSPHLQVYRLPLTAVLSISHRFTGAFLSLGTLLLIAVLVAAASGSHAYSTIHALVTSWLGQLLLFLWTYALYFHLCNGIRHLIWDIGFGFDLDVAEKTAWSVVVVSTVLTVMTWVIAFAARGG